MMTYELTHTISKHAFAAYNWSKMAIFNLKTPIMKFTILAVFMLAFTLITAPTAAQADSTTTYYIPLPGYYLNANGQPLNGQTGYQYSCVNSICSPVTTTSGNTTAGSGATGNAAGVTPAYTNCGTSYCQYYGSQYPYPTYQPYTSTPQYTNGTGNNAGYQFQYYPYQTYTPYVKTGPGAYTLGQTKSTPYYSFGPDGKLLNQGNTAMRYGNTGGTGTGFIPTNSQSGYGVPGGFVMTNPGY